MAGKKLFCVDQRESLVCLVHRADQGSLFGVLFLGKFLDTVSVASRRQQIKTQVSNTALCIGLHSGKKKQDWLGSPAFPLGCCPIDYARDSIVRGELCVRHLLFLVEIVLFFLMSFPHCEQLISHPLVYDLVAFY